MQGIRTAEFKILLDSLSNLRQVGTPVLPEDQFETVVEKEKELKEIYANYKTSLQQVSENIRQFENHKHSIRRLMKKSRHYLKDFKKNGNGPASEE